MGLHPQPASNLARPAAGGLRSPAGLESRGRLWEGEGKGGEARLTGPSGYKHLTCTGLSVRPEPPPGSVRLDDLPDLSVSHPLLAKWKTLIAKSTSEKARDSLR